jgi:hypothetical protein
MKGRAIINAIAIMVVATTLPSSVVVNAQGCEISRVTSTGGREIHSESGGYISVPKYNQSGVEIGREIFLKAQSIDAATGSLRRDAKPVMTFDDYEWNKGQLTRRATDTRTGRVIIETLDADRIDGLCR